MAPPRGTVPPFRGPAAGQGPAGRGHGRTRGYARLHPAERGRTLLATGRRVLVQVAPRAQGFERGRSRQSHTPRTSRPSGTRLAALALPRISYEFGYRRTGGF